MCPSYHDEGICQVVFSGKPDMDIEDEVPMNPLPTRPGLTYRLRLLTRQPQACGNNYSVAGR